MTNVNIRILMDAEAKGATAEFAKLQGQVTALNSQLAKMVALQNGVDGQGFNRMAAAANANDRAFRSAVASTGMFEQQQVRVNSATETYIDNLQKQKLSFRQMMKDRKVATAAYKEQIALENMVVRKSAMSNARGKELLDVTHARQVSAELDTANKRLGWFGHQLASGGRQMVNWGKNTQWAGRQLMVGFTIPMAAAGAAAGVLAYQIDQEFTRIKKVYDTTADANSSSMKDIMAVEKELMSLREAGTATAIESARKYGAAAKDTLSVQAELAATGLKGTELQKATAEVMRISRLGELEYQDAINSTISLQTVFKQNTDQLADSFNYMNAIENATSLQTVDFAQAIPIAAAPVKAFGGDVRELGILLTAMKSQGIEATQGANAIKAAMQRLGRPSKQIKQEWADLTGTDITQIFESSESLTDMFQKISAATDELTDKQRIKAFAGLFGTYQVTRMSAMVDGLKDIDDSTSQVGRAFEIAGQSSEENMKIANREIEKLNESFSAQFKNTLAELQIQLATLGKPFVQMATLVLKGVSWLIKGFNSLPDIAKWGIGGAAGIAAITGPLLMLAGITGNLAGNLTTGVGSMLRWIGTLKLGTVSQRAAALAAEAAESGFVSERTAVQQLTAEMNKLILAQNEANRLTALATRQSSNRRTQMATQAATATAQAATLSGASPQMMGMPLGLAGPEKKIYHPKINNFPVAVDEKRTAEAQKMAQAERDREMSMVASRNAAAGEATEREKTNKAARGAAIATGVAALSMATMMGTSNETANSIAQYALIATLVVPAVKMLVPLLKSAAVFAWSQAAALKASAMSAGSAGLAKGLRGNLAAAGAAIGKTNLVLAGVTAVAYGFWKLRDMEKKAAEERLKTQSNINSSAEKYADSIGAARREWEGIETFSGTKAQQTGFQKSQEYFNDSEEGKSIASNFGDMDEMEQRRYAMERYVYLITEFKITSEEAATNLSALYNVGAGQNATASQRIAEDIAKELGDLKNMDWDSAIANVRQRFDDALGAVGEAGVWGDPEEFAKTAEKEGKMVAETFLKAISTADTQAEYADMFGQLEDAALKSWTDLDKYMTESTQKAQWAELWKQQGIDSVKEFSQWYRANDPNEIMAAFGEAGMDPMRAGFFRDLMENANTAESSIIRSYAAMQGLGDEINTVWELQSHWNVAAKSLNYKDARKEVEDIFNKTLDLDQELSIGGAYWKDLLKTTGGIRQALAAADPEKVALMNDALNAFADANDIKRGSDAAETYYNIMNNVKGEVDDTTSAVDRATAAARKLAQAFSMSAQEAAQIRQGAMQNVQQGIADAISDDFDTRMNNAIEQREAYWDRRSEALDEQVERRRESQQDRQARESEQLEGRHEREQRAQEATHERQQRALDVRWERKNSNAEKYWDRRIESVNKAIKAEEKAEEKRQKMFDAEIARISKLNSAMNQNIDFNVALSTGKFDEAAKIRNDISSEAAQTALERASEEGAGASSRRVDRMQNRVDGIEKARDRHMENLKKQEEAERRHLEKVQRMQQRALERRTKAQKKALEKQHENQRDALERQTEAQKKALETMTKNDLASQRKRWEAEKKNLDRRLDLFLSYVAKNEKDLKKHMKKVGLAYDGFGKKLMKRGDLWSKHFGDEMKGQIRKAGLALQSDKMWEKLGKSSLNGVLKGMGFANQKEFRHFLNTGEMKRFKGADPKGPSGRNKNTDDNRYVPHHTGGMVGRDPGSRKGVARSTRGLHPSEQMVLAQKGEYIVNRSATEKNADVLERINNGGTLTGRDDGSSNVRGIGGPGIAEAISSVAARGVVAGIIKRVQTENARKQASMAMMGSMFDAGKAGMYGDRAFSMSQLGHAATIASVGSNMGMSKRDIMIGIMTAITESGLALPNQAQSDRDSAGLFQQRPSQGWGSVEQVMNPEYAARKFFSVLKGVSNRGDMSPWMAAQTVQRSAYSDGSNYRQYWDEAQAILGRGLSKTKSGFAASAGFMQGGGGRSRPVRGGVLTQGLHSNNGIDIGVTRGTPVYSVADGRVTNSYDIPGPLSTDRYNGDGPYGSYGRVIKISHGAFDTLYAHLSKRFAAQGQTVRGGAKIGLSGNTGNSSGPHLHFEAHGASPTAFLKQGGTIRNDNTPAVLHRDERVLTAPITKKLDYAVDSMYRTARGESSQKFGIGGPSGRGRQARPYGPFSYPTSVTGMADAPHTWMGTGTPMFNTLAGGKPRKGGTPGRSSSPGRGSTYNPGKTPSLGNVNDSGRKAVVRMGTMNAYVGNSAAKTIADLKTLTKRADFLALTEMKHKYGKVGKWLNQKNWGYIGGKGKEQNSSLMAFNRARYELLRRGTRKLGNMKGDFIGGREHRYANYGLFKDKKTGRKMWQVAAHTVPTPNMRGRRKDIFQEQWANIDRLVTELRKTGSPVFLSGDVNQRPDRSWWRPPKGLRARAGGTLDWMFADPRFAKAGKTTLLRNMHTDHAGAYLSNFTMPSMKVGGNVKWDNTIANLHKNERVLTAPLSKKLDVGLDNLANNGGNEYHVHMTVNGGSHSVDELADKVVVKLKRTESRKPQSRRGGNH